MKTASVHAFLKKYNIHPKKSLGQHFLCAQPTIEKIAASLDIDNASHVLEIGPGPAIMTGLIAKRAERVVAVEFDRAMIEIAQSELAEFENIEWINNDILDVMLHDIARAGKKLIVAGNLPYNISSPIMFWMLDNHEHISSAVVMLQKEVAVRIAAKPGGKDYGILSVLLQAHGDVKKLFDVARTNFLPPPDVTSSVIKIKFRSGDCGIADENFFRLLVKSAFAKRRKTIRNALVTAAALKKSADQIDAALSEVKIDSKRRAETISVSDFISLANILWEAR